MHVCQELQVLGAHPIALMHALHAQAMAFSPDGTLSWRERADRLTQGFCSPAPWPMPAKENLRDTGLRLWDTVRNPHDEDL